MKHILYNMCLIQLLQLENASQITQMSLFITPKPVINSTKSVINPIWIEQCTKLKLLIF